MGNSTKAEKFFPIGPVRKMLASSMFMLVAVRRKIEPSDGTIFRRTATSMNIEDASIFLTGPIGKNFSAFVEFPMFETKAWEFTPTGPAEANDHTPFRQ